MNVGATFGIPARVGIRKIKYLFITQKYWGWY